jgi:LuxR family quorum sensing-dependent transcriptional regulator
MPPDQLQRAAAFVERCVEPIALPHLIDEFRELARGFGFPHTVCGAWAGLGKQRVYRFFFNDWPADWLQLYNERDFFPDDPFVMEARRSMVPFLWSLTEERQPLTPRARDVYEAGRAYGWREVLGVPIHGPLGYQGLSSLATLEPVSLSAADIACLEMLVRAIHDRCRREFGFGLDPDGIPKFTPREIECLQWVAAGKSDWEIAQVLGISSSTVHFHIERAKKKLGLTSRTEAAARLTLYGLI